MERERRRIKETPKKKKGTRRFLWKTVAAFLIVLFAVYLREKMPDGIERMRFILMEWTIPIPPLP